MQMSYTSKPTWQSLSKVDRKTARLSVSTEKNAISLADTDKIANAHHLYFLLVVFSPFLLSMYSWIGAEQWDSMDNRAVTASVYKAPVPPQNS